MPYTNPVVSGSVLVRTAIQSIDYVAGASGWAIMRDGNAEFNNGLFRGVVEVDNASGSFVHIEPDADSSVINIMPANSVNPGVTYFQAQIYCDAFNAVTDQTQLNLSSPLISTPTQHDNAFLALISRDITDSPSMVKLNADQVQLEAATIVDGDGLDVLRGQSGQTPVSTVGASTVFSQVVNFPVAFPVGVTPVVPAPNLNTTAATGQLWTLRATSVTNTGFTIVGSRSGAAVTLTNIPVDWIAVVAH